MKKTKYIVLAALMLAAVTFTSVAQTNIITVTNVVTVLVTNVVTITNVVATDPAAPAPTVTADAAAATVKPVPQYPWESSVSAGLTLTRGNSHSLLFTGDYLTAKKTPKNEYSLGLEAAYGRQDAQDTVNNSKAFGQWNHLYSSRFYDYVRADALRDIVADLDYRASVGPGLGYYLIKNDKTTFAAEAGGGMEVEHLGGKYDSFGTMRLAERFEHKFGERARLWENAEILPQVDQLDNYVVNFEIGIESAISKSFSLKTYLDDSYQSIPAAGRQKNDIKLVSGISYKF